MKKYLMLVTLLLAATSFGGNITSIGDAEKTETKLREVYDKIPKVANKIVEHSKKYKEQTDKFSELIAKGAIKAAVEKAKATGKDVEIDLKKIEQISIDIKSAYIEAEEREKKSIEPSRVVFSDLSNKLNKLGKELEKEVAVIVNDEEVKKEMEPYFTWLKEGVEFTKEFIDLSTEEKMLIDTFGGERRTTPVSPELRSVAARYVENASGDYEKERKIKTEYEAKRKLLTNVPGPMATIGKLIDSVVKLDLDKNVALQDLRDNRQEVRILENRVDINKNAENIEKIKMSVMNNETRITEVEKKLDRGISQMAAMTAIDFQGVETGEIGIGAGIGSHSSTKSVALGVAYKPTSSFYVNAKMSATPQKKLTQSTVGVGAVYKFKLR